MPRSRTPTSRASEIYARLRRDLVDGAIAPGTRLVVAELQERYGFGAMPLREALNRLSAEQLVLKHDQRGFSVPPLDPLAFLEMQNARIVVETAALRASVLRHCPEWEDRLVLAFHHLSKAGQSSSDYLLSDAWSEAHAVFHHELISGCANEWLLSVADHLYKQSARYRARRRFIDSGSPVEREGLLREHGIIMEAAIAGDAALACARLIDHYRRSVETVLGAPIEVGDMPLPFRRPSSPAPAAEGRSR